jgi:c-di-GMP-binding flagellar brake protein YcgR
MDTATTHSSQQIVQRQEIENILQQLLLSQETLYCNSNEEDRLVGFRIQQLNDGYITLLPIGDYTLHQRLSSAPDLQLWSRHNQIRISFCVERMGRLNSPTQFVSLPASITLWQQRNTTRTTPSYAEPLICRFVDHNGIPVSAQITDISEGGVGLIETDYANELQWGKGQHFMDCSLELGKFGQLNVDLSLCYVERRLSERGVQQIHAGAQFVHPTPQIRHSIAQYRNQIELSRQRHLWRHQLIS